jgi:hypothetical protein
MKTIFDSLANRKQRPESAFIKVQNVIVSESNQNNVYVTVIALFVSWNTSI